MPVTSLRSFATQISRYSVLRHLRKYAQYDWDHLGWHRTSYLPGVEVNHDQEGGSSKARLFHCTSVELTLTITPNVGNLNASFLLVGDCVRAIPLQLRFIFHIFHWDYRCYWKCSREVRATPKIISVKIHVLENKGHGQTQALHTYRINLSPFTKDFRVWGAFIETNLISPGPHSQGSDKDNEYHLIWRNLGILTYLLVTRKHSWERMSKVKDLFEHASLCLKRPS